MRPQFFRRKPRALVDKRTTVQEAVSRLVSDGDYIGIGGFGTNRIPTAILHEIIRQGKKRLGLSGHTATHDFQILAAGGAIDRVDVAYVIGLEARGLSKTARRLFEEARIQVCEWTNAASPGGNGPPSWVYPSSRPESCSAPTRMRYSAAKRSFAPSPVKSCLALPPCRRTWRLSRPPLRMYGNAQIDGIYFQTRTSPGQAKSHHQRREIVPEEVISKTCRTVIPASA